MTVDAGSAYAPEARWLDACRAAALFAVDPAGLGLCLRARQGPPRERWMELVRALLPAEVQMRRVPLGIADDRLLGGLDLTATLAAGRPVLGRGLLAEADGHVLVLAMAERMTPSTAGRLLAAQESGEVAVERDGFAERVPFRAGVLAVDEGAERDEQPPAALLDRLAIRLDLDAIPVASLHPAKWDSAQVIAARARLPGVVLGEALLEALCGTAAALGIYSSRAPLLAIRVARAAAALEGRDTVEEEDAALAARLVYSARATLLPAPPDSEAEPSPPPEQGDDAPLEPQEAKGEPPPAQEPGEEVTAAADMVLEAALAALPPGLLAQLQTSGGAGAKPTAGRVGAARASKLRGRPIGSTPGELGAGARLALVDTLRAAAPWQRLRDAKPGRIAVRTSDIRITRFSARTRTTTVFAVDASGSSARNRLAEAKGAVEMLLADCYVRRDQVAVIGFRGRGAELLLPPTGSLVRAKRSLAGLPGGGGTPLASGIDAAVALALTLRRRGDTPVLVLLTDGSPNIGRDGAPGRAKAAADALDAARALRAAGCMALVVDTSPRPQALTKQLAEAMAARYVPLPYADAAAVSRVLSKDAYKRT